MKGISGWHYAPYRPYHRQGEVWKPFICRLAPGEDSIALAWFDKGGSGAHLLRYRLMGSEDAWKVMPVNQADVTLTGLAVETEYELQLLRAEGDAMSSLRYVRTGVVPGTVVNYLHPKDEAYGFSGHFLCSPCILKLESGALLASMDVFGPEMPQNLTLIFRSDDRGETWHYVTDLFPCYWATLFLHQGRLYAQGCSTEYGDVVIGYSEDEGCTWSAPVHLFCGACSPYQAGWQRTPMPIVRKDGRLWVSMDYGSWVTGGHGICALSAPEESNLMNPADWTASELTFYSPEWAGAPVGKSGGLLEGNMVLAPNGHLVDIIRLQMVGCVPNHGQAVMLAVNTSDPEAAPAFERMIDLPSGANSKSYVLFDEVSGRYYAIGNLVVNEETPTQRNIVVLQTSDDLISWRICQRLIDYSETDSTKVGFQYMTFLIDGDDILFLCRTALCGADSYHNANLQTFHTVKNFREL